MKYLDCKKEVVLFFQYYFHRFRPYLQDIRIWLVIAFLLRLYGITNPPIDGAYNWREVDVLGVARNFLELDANIFYPRIDFAGDKSGITGMEFPLLNYLIYIAMSIFGFDHWYGRVINLCFASVGIFFFYRTIKNYFRYELAFPATLLLIFSLWFAYSRKTIPDPFCASLSMIAIYYGLHYLYKDSNRYKSLLIYFVFGMFGILSKIPSALMYTIFLLSVFDTRVSSRRKFYFVIFSFFLLLPSVVWYYYWSPHLKSVYGFSYFYGGVSVWQGAIEIVKHFDKFILSVSRSALGYSGFSLYIWGSIQIIRGKDKNFFYLFLLSVLTMAFFILKAGGAIHHAYYILWWLPAMCLIASYGIEKIQNKKLATFFLVCICIEGVANRAHHFWIDREKVPLLGLEEMLDTFSKKSDRIAINSVGDPIAMYFSHRKGWLTDNRNLQNTLFQNKIKQKGCKYIIILKKIKEKDVILNLPIIKESEDFRVYKL